MQIDNFHLMSLLGQHPLQLLLSEWSQAAKVQDLDLLHDQVELRTQILQHLLQTLPAPEPFAQSSGVETLENELALLNELSEYLWADLALLNQELDTYRFEISLQSLNQRMALVEAAMRDSFALEALEQEVQDLQTEIRITFQQIFDQTWNQQDIWLLETRREILLDRFDRLQEQIIAFSKPHEMTGLLKQFRTLSALMESLEEAIEGLDAIENTSQTWQNLLC